MRASSNALCFFVIFAAIFASAGCQPQAGPVSQPTIAGKARPAEAQPAAGQQPTAPGVSTAESAQTGAAPTISFETTEHDFGEVGPASKNNCEFKFQNTGTGVLKVEKTWGTCGCTALELAKDEYAPGETGALKVRFDAPTNPGPIVKHIFVTSNDPKNPKVQLAIKATVVLKVTVTPDKLQLSLKQENAGCPELTIASTDGGLFSITGFESPTDCITAEFNPEEKAQQFVLHPKVDMEKLRRMLRGSIRIYLTHPGVSQLSVSYFAPAEFQAQPGTLIIQQGEPGLPVRRELWLRNNYGEEFNVESVSSQKSAIKVLSQEKQAGQFKLDLEITPPEPAGALRFFRDVLEIKIKEGPTIEVNCSIWYSRQSK
jgi:hypothetical protein